MITSFLYPLYQDLKNILLDILFPITCITCNTNGELICNNCKESLQKLKHQLCIVCQKPTPFGLTHPKCKSSQTADALISIYNYHDEKIKKIIITGKYKFIPKVFEELGILIATEIQKNHSDVIGTIPYSLTPIPLHKIRHNWRGFNQSEILARIISEHLKIPCKKLLKRSKITRTQKDLNKQERQKNLKDAFGLNISYQKSDVLNKNILLIDDVTTTGATLNQAVKVLKHNGAKSVICLTVARD